MKSISIEKINLNAYTSPMDEIERVLVAKEAHAVTNVQWNPIQKPVEISFSMAYAENGIFIHYRVNEYSLRAVYLNDNEPVYKDSCVELFISLPEIEGYYNFECNAISSLLAQYGTQRNDREYLEQNAMQALRRKGSYPHKAIQREGTKESWTMTLAIPFSAFSKHTISSLDGKTIRANIYKCGDDLPEPHYISWNRIEQEEADFHVPAFFGKIHCSV